MEAARGCWRHLRTMFQELEECRAFELAQGVILSVSIGYNGWSRTVA